MCFGERRVDVVTYPVDDRYSRVQLPAILRKEAWLPAAVVRRREVEVALLIVEGSEESRGNLVVLSLPLTTAVYSVARQIEAVGSDC